MIIYEANPIPGPLQAIAAGKVPDSGHGSALRQQALLRQQQSRLNEAVAEQRARAAVERELAAEAAKQGRYH